MRENDIEHRDSNIRLRDSGIGLKDSDTGLKDNDIGLRDNNTILDSIGSGNTNRNRRQELDQKMISRQQLDQKITRSIDNNWI